MHKEYAAPSPRSLVLASTSPFRRLLLERLNLPFETDSPDIDETRHLGEEADTLVKRLSREKAFAVSHKHSNSLIIGSDQVACIEGNILGKPGTKEKAIEQLLVASGKKVTFYTGLTLLDAETGMVDTECTPFHVYFRKLSREQVARYIEIEQPLSCAGSFKSEGLGITLFEKLEGDDPNSLIGLPLILLVSMLSNHGINLP